MAMTAQEKEMERKRRAMEGPMDIRPTVLDPQVRADYPKERTALLAASAVQQRQAADAAATLASQQQAARMANAPVSVAGARPMGVRDINIKTGLPYTGLGYRAGDNGQIVTQTPTAPSALPTTDPRYRPVVPVPGEVAPAVTSPTSLTRAPPAPEYDPTYGDAPRPPPATPMGDITGLTRIVKTIDANGNSVYTQAPALPPDAPGSMTIRPSGSTSRIYDVMGNRADVANPASLQINRAGQSIGDLYRGQDAIADPTYATAARGQNVQARLEALNAEGKINAEKNPIYNELVNGDKKPIDPMQLAKLMMQGQEYADKRKDRGEDNARADKAETRTGETARQAADLADAKNANDITSRWTTPDEEGNVRGPAAGEIRALTQLSDSNLNFFANDPKGGAALAGGDLLLKKYLKSKSGLWAALSRGIGGADDAKVVSLANVKGVDGKPGQYELRYNGKTVPISPADLDGMDERTFAKLVEAHRVAKE